MSLVLLTRCSGTETSPRAFVIWQLTLCTMWFPAPKWNGQWDASTPTILWAHNTQSIRFLPQKKEAAPPSWLNLVQSALARTNFCNCLANSHLTTCSVASTVKISSNPDNI